MNCKKCGELLLSDNIYKNDKRYCITCGTKHAEYLAERRATLDSLRQMNLDSKIIQTKFLIREAVHEFGLDKVYISYSGGKDSTVLSHIAKELYPNILHIFSNTTNEYPETLEHIKWESEHNGTNIISVLPKDSHGVIWTFKKVVECYGYPMFSKRVSNAIRTYQHALSVQTKQNSEDYINRCFKKYSQYKELPISDKCCDKLKKEPIRKKARELGLKCAILGILATESYQREKTGSNMDVTYFMNEAIIKAVHYLFGPKKTFSNTLIDLMSKYPSYITSVICVMAVCIAVLEYT